MQRLKRIKIVFVNNIETILVQKKLHKTNYTIRNLNIFKEIYHHKKL